MSENAVQLMVPPDPDDNREMWMTLQIVSALGRTDMNTFVMLLILLVLYAAVRIFIAVCVYLFRLYRERAFTPNAYQHLFRITLMVGGGLATVALLGMASPDTYDAGVVLLCYVFGAFSITSAVLDWYAQRQGPQETLALEGLTADEVLDWQGQVNDAYDQGLVARGS